jgi:glycosyltransferase involved in cell wall biosynthesis
MPKISIVTPCYNAEQFIEEAIQSVISQRGDFEIEYFIVDGASTDRTTEIIRQYCELVDSGRHPLRCRQVTMSYVSEKDTSMYEAVAKGLEQVTGDIVAYINADDFYQSNAFSTVVDVLDQHPDVDWITSVNLFYNEKSQITRSSLPFRYRSEWIRKGMYGSVLPFIQQESTFWRGKLLPFIDIAKLKTYRLAGDYYLWHTFSQHAQLSIVNTWLGGFRISEHQLSRQLDEYFKEFASIADPKTWLDVLLGRVLNRVQYHLTDEWKMTLNKQIIRHKNNTWRKGQD